MSRKTFRKVIAGLDLWSKRLRRRLNCIRGGDWLAVFLLLLPAMLLALLIVITNR